MGIESEHPMIGRDIFSMPADLPGRALMQYADTNAFRVGNRVVIHQPHQPAKTYSYIDGRLVPRTSDPALERDALAHLLWAERTYREHRYRLPQPKPWSADPASPLVTKATTPTNEAFASMR
jgi:phosphoglycerol transferase